MLVNHLDNLLPFMCVDFDEVFRQKPVISHFLGLLSQTTTCHFIGLWITTQQSSQGLLHAGQLRPLISLRTLQGSGVEFSFLSTRVTYIWDKTMLF